MSMQPNEAMEFSRYGVKLTYTRFLSDSAPGFLFILAIVLLYYLMDINWFQSIGTEVQIGILILAFLIATPLGLAINAISWIFLGCTEVYFAKCFMKNINNNSFLAFTYPSRIDYAFDRIRDLYWPNDRKTQSDSPGEEEENKVNGIRKEQKSKLLGNTELVYEYSKYYQTLLLVYFPLDYVQTGHIIGLKSLLRSIAFMTICILVGLLLLILVNWLCYICFIEDFQLCRFAVNFWDTHSKYFIGIVIILLFLIIIISIYASGFLEFYASIKVLSYVQALVMLKQNWNGESCEDRLKEIARYLVTLGKSRLNKTIRQ